MVKFVTLLFESITICRGSWVVGRGRGYGSWVKAVGKRNIK